MSPVSELVLLLCHLLPAQLTVSLLLHRRPLAVPQTLALTVQHLVSVTLRVFPETLQNIFTEFLCYQDKIYLNRSLSSSEEKWDGTTC